VSAVVGLDPSLTACGIAVLTDHTGVPYVEFLRTVGHRGHDAASWDERSDRVVSQARHVANIVLGANPDLVIIEGPSYGSQFGSQFDRAALWMGLYSTLRAKGIPVGVCSPRTRAKWASGKGNADKATVLAAVREQWPADRIRNDNEADALTMAALGALKLGWQLPFEIKERHHVGLDAVAWTKEIA